MTEYFVYCEYDDCYCPRATFIPYNSQDLEILSKINQIVELGNKIENCYKKEDNMRHHIGYKIGDIFDDSEKTKEIVSYWSTLLHRIDHDHEGELPDEYRLYYINDENRNCSPLELYKRLSEMSEYENKPIIIKQCVMLSCVPFNKIKRTSLEFFVASGGQTSEQIRELLLKTQKFHSVECASKDSGECAGYGFVQLMDNNDYALFVNKCIGIDNIVFSFR